MYDKINWNLYDEFAGQQEQQDNAERMAAGVNGISASDIALDTFDKYLADNWYPFIPTTLTDEDVVDQPPHYMIGGMEAIDVIEAKLTPEEYQGYLKGNVLKYMMRANYKGKHDQDLEKALWYLDEQVNGKA
jgi:hypothetical protein